MKLPASILACLRGPLVAVTVAGCTSPAAAPISQDAPTAHEAQVTTDAVAYDAEAERERLVRLDREHAAEEHRRERRIALRETVERRPARPVSPPDRLDALLAACGRG